MVACKRFHLLFRWLDDLEPHRPTHTKRHEGCGWMRAWSERARDNVSEGRNDSVMWCWRHKKTTASRHTLCHVTLFPVYRDMTETDLFK